MLEVFVGHLQVVLRGHALGVADPLADLGVGSHNEGTMELRILYNRTPAVGIGQATAARAADSP